MFGGEGGPCVINSAETADLIIQSLFPDAEAGVGLILVSPCCPKKKALGSFKSKVVYSISKYAFGFGHLSALTFTRSDGLARVHNICNPNTATRPPIASTLEMEEYFFSTSRHAFSLSEQFGIYNRSFSLYAVPSSIEQVENVRRMFHDLSQSSTAGYSLTPFHSWIWSMIGLGRTPTTERGVGNCAEWISHIFTEANILTRRYAFPGLIVADLATHGASVRSLQLERAQHAAVHPINQDYLLDEIPLRQGWLHWKLNEIYSQRRVPLPAINLGLTLGVPAGDQVVRINRDHSDMAKVMQLPEPAKFLVPLAAAVVFTILDSHLGIALLVAAMLGLVSIADGSSLVLDSWFVILTMWPYFAVLNLVLSPAGLPVLTATLTVLLWLTTGYGYVC